MTGDSKKETAFSHVKANYQPLRHMHFLKANWQLL